MDDLTCPRCKTTKYRNPALKLLVNTCGHALCDNCVELLFVKGSGSCPECNIPLRRTGFRLQLFEDPTVEKEVDIRRRVLKDFTKQQSDFPSLREFNDYLEQVETIIFNLVNNIDIVETHKEIEQYKKDNKDQITKSRTRRPDQLLELDRILEQEVSQNERRHRENLMLHRAEKLRKLKSQDALIDDLMFLEGVDAKKIVEQHKAQKATSGPEKPETDENLDKDKLSGEISSQGVVGGFSSSTIGFRSGSQFGSFLPVPKVEDVALFVYRAFQLEVCGPRPPSKSELLAFNRHQQQIGGYLSHIREASAPEIAGGYHHVLACRRALQDAFMDIALQPQMLHQEQNLQNQQQFQLQQHQLQHPFQDQSDESRSSI